jgi:hypothetical protein
MRLPGCSFETYSPQQTLSALALAAPAVFQKVEDARTAALWSTLVKQRRLEDGIGSK